MAVLFSYYLPFVFSQNENESANETNTLLSSSSNPNSNSTANLTSWEDVNKLEKISDDDFVFESAENRTNTTVSPNVEKNKKKKSKSKNKTKKKKDKKTSSENEITQEIGNITNTQDNTVQSSEGENNKSVNISKEEDIQGQDKEIKTNKPDDIRAKADDGEVADPGKKTKKKKNKKNSIDKDIKEIDKIYKEEKEKVDKKYKKSKKKKKSKKEEEFEEEFNMEKVKNEAQQDNNNDDLYKNAEEINSKEKKKKKKEKKISQEEEKEMEEWERLISNFEPSDLLTIKVPSGGSEIYYEYVKTVPSFIKIAHFVNDETSKIDFSVSAPNGSILYNKNKKNRIYHEFYVTETGIYKFNLDNSNYKVAKKTTFAIHAGNNTDASVSKDHIDVFFSQLERVEKKVKEVSMTHKIINSKMDGHYDSTKQHNSNIFKFSAIETMVMVVIFIIQLVYIKNLIKA